MKASICYLTSSKSALLGRIIILQEEHISTIDCTAFKHKYFRLNYNSFYSSIYLSIFPSPENIPEQTDVKPEGQQTSVLFFRSFAIKYPESGHRFKPELEFVI